jgi:hypothetical protein
MQSHCRQQVFELLAESVRQSRKPTHTHSHRQILAFNQTVEMCFLSGEPLITVRATPVTRGGA